MLLSLDISQSNKKNLKNFFLKKKKVRFKLCEIESKNWFIKLYMQDDRKIITK